MTTPDEGLDKAALLLMTLGADAAAGVLRQLGPREVQKLSLKMSEMTPQARSAVEPVLADMIESFGRGAMIQSDEDQLREMLTKALGDERASQLLSRMMSGTETLLFILSAGCKDDEPTAKFGEPCGRDESEPDCADDLQCEGYCAPLCEQDSDCPTIEGYRHECVLGQCFIACDEATRSCPQTLGTPLKCGIGLCERAS